MALFDEIDLDAYPADTDLFVLLLDYVYLFGAQTTMTFNGSVS